MLINQTHLTTTTTTTTTLQPPRNSNQKHPYAGLMINSMVVQELGGVVAALNA